MKLQIDASGVAELIDSDDFKRFSIVEANPGASRGCAAVVDVAEDNHYWLDAQAIVEISKRGEDSEWTEQFWNMLRMVEPYGFSDMAAGRIKAHVETPD